MLSPYATGWAALLSRRAEGIGPAKDKEGSNFLTATRSLDDLMYNTNLLPTCRNFRRGRREDFPAAS